MNQEIQTAMLSILAAVLSVALPMILKYFRDYMAQKEKEWTENNKQEKYNKYITMASQTVVDVVTCIEQTTVDHLKKENAFTEEAQKQVFEQAKQQIIYLLSKSAMDALTEVYGDAEAWLDAKIEAEVRNLKREDKKAAITKYLY